LLCLALEVATDQLRAEPLLIPIVRRLLRCWRSRRLGYLSRSRGARCLSTRWRLGYLDRSWGLRNLGRGRRLRLLSGSGCLVDRLLEVDALFELVLEVQTCGNRLIYRLGGLHARFEQPQRLPEFREFRGRFVDLLPSELEHLLVERSAPAIGLNHRSSPRQKWRACTPRFPKYTARTHKWQVEKI